MRDAMGGTTRTMGSGVTLMMDEAALIKRLPGMAAGRHGR